MEGGASQEEEVASECHQRAQQALLQGNYGRAFAHYLLLVRMSPSLRSEVKENLTLALREWAEQLEGAGRGHDVLACYQQACDVFPDCETMLSNMGAHLFRLGYVDEAACCFRRALRINPDFLGARENLDNVCGHLVERWHFRMLNDITRNSKYRDAIHAAVENGHSRVLDIGAGTGLLGLFAVEAGAADIYGCEMSKTMYDVACDVLRANQAAEKVTLMHKKSTDLKIPDDLQDRVTLVVTETVDAGLLGEHILSTLQHAWKHLLVPNDENLNTKGASRASLTGKPTSCVIPAGATVYIAGIESEYIRRHNRLLYPGLRHVDLSEVDITCRTGQASTCHGDEEASEWEPYTTERLRSLPGGYKLLTDVTQALQLDFNNPRMIETYLQGAAHDLVLPVTRQGRLDAIALWFDLELYDSITMSTSPEAESCWEQTIYPALPSHLHSGGRESLLVKPGESLLVACICSNNALSLQCTELRAAPAVRPSATSSLLCHYSVQPQLPPHVHIPTTSSSAAATSSSPPTSVDSNTQTDPGGAEGGGSESIVVGHNYDLTICKPEQSGTFLYQQAGGGSESGAGQGPGLGQMLPPPPYGQLPLPPPPPPHVGLPPPPPLLLGAQTTWQHPGSWYQDLVWPHHQVQQAWPQPDPRLWPQQPPQYQQQQPQRAYPQQYQPQTQYQPQPPPHHQPPIQQQQHRNDSPQRPESTESHEPPPYLPLPLSYSSTIGTINPVSSFSPISSDLSQHSPRADAGAGGTGSGDLLPALPQSEYTDFLRQQLRDAVHAAEMDTTYRSFVIRSQTSPDVRANNNSSRGNRPTVHSRSSSSSNTKATTPTTTTKHLPVTPTGSSSPWSQWTWGQPISRSVDSLVTAAKQGYLRNTPKETFLLDRYELSRLNDIDSNTAFCSALEKVKKNHFSGKGFTMLDLTRGFSTLPLQSLKIGASEVAIMETASQTQMELLCCLAPANGLTPSAVRFLCGNVEDVEAEWDVVVTELIDHCGALTQQVLEQIALARVTCLRPGGIVMPWSATVYGMVVEAPALLNDSAVISDEHTLDLQIAQFMNDFQMTTHVDITLSTLSYKKLSQPFELFKFNFNERTPSKVPDFLNQSSTLTLSTIDSGQVTAVIYWFELLLTPEVKLSTVDTKLRWRQAAVMQKGRPEVLAGRPITVKAVCKNSCIDIKVQLN